jgi:hypothetical protein
MESPLIRWKRQAKEAEKKRVDAYEKSIANLWSEPWSAAQKKVAMNKRMAARNAARRATIHDPKVTNRRARHAAREALLERLQQPKRPWR